MLRTGARGAGTGSSVEVAEVSAAKGPVAVQKVAARLQATLVHLGPTVAALVVSWPMPHVFLHLPPPLSLRPRTVGVATVIAAAPSTLAPLDLCGTI